MNGPVPGSGQFQRQLKGKREQLSIMLLIKINF